MSFNFLRGPTNQHLELSRLLWAVSVVAGIGFAGAHLYLDHTFSIIEFGTVLSWKPNSSRTSKPAAARSAPRVSRP